MCLILIIFLLAIEPSGALQEWEPPMSRNRTYSTQVSASGSTPDGLTETTLAVRCLPGTKGRGYVEFVYTVKRARDMKNFNFTDFEGPDAPAGAKKLVRVIVYSKSHNVTAKVSVTGGLKGDDPDAFEFSFAARGYRKGDITRLVDTIRQGASMISVTVHDYRDSKKTIHTDFSTTGASNAVDRLMKNCGK